MVFVCLLNAASVTKVIDGHCVIKPIITWSALFMNADVGPELWRVLRQLNPPGPVLQRGNPNLAEGDPLPIFLNFFS